ncbi:hypothetical protein ANCDUO_00499 [Ancylostoma duodenale]|uniref:Uncharacterized protein n=1 Tax=Ancylostoma duodenale TaxID=51022 RepID=A0A0C2DGR4_9BILA|nr:hypothetical protein ANCDUO_00499 [Ancylostoma duodenale]
MNIDSFEQLTTRIGPLQLRRCGSTAVVTIFVVNAPTSSYDEEEIEAFYMDWPDFGKMRLSTTSTRSTIGLFSISTTAQRASRVQEPRGDCLTRSWSLYASVEPREPQATTS